MLNRYYAEVVDRTLRDIRRTVDNANQYKSFGEKVVVFGGDFRKTFLVVRKCCRHDIVTTSINSSDLWKYYKGLTLSKNTRLTALTPNKDTVDITNFTDWMLDIGNGK